MLINSKGRNKAELLNAAAYFFSRGLALLVQLLTFPFLSRQLGLEVFGDFLYVQAIVALLVVFVDFGFSTSASKAVAIEENIDKRRAYFYEIQIFRFFVACCLCIFLAVFAWCFFDYYRRIFCFAATLAILGSALNCQWFYQGVKKGVSFVILSTLPRVAILFCIVFLTGSDNYLPLAIVYFGSDFVSGLIIKGRAMYYLGWRADGISHKNILKEVLIALPNCLLSFVYAAASAAPQLIISYLLGPIVLAKYSVADKLIRVAHSLIWPVAQAYYPKACEIWNKSSVADAVKASRILLLVLCAIGLVASILIFLLSVPIINFLYGSRFNESAKLLGYLSPFLALAALNTSLTYYFFYPNGAYTLVTINAVLSSVIGVLILFFGVYFFDILGGCVGVVLMELIFTIFLLKNISKYAKV